MKYLCLAYEEERQFAEMSEAEWQALREETYGVSGQAQYRREFSIVT